MSNSPTPGLRYYYDQTDQLFKAPGRGDLSTAAGATPNPDWSDTNLPWAYTDTAVFTEKWPAGVTIVPIQTGSPDFFTNLQNTVNAAGTRCVVKLGTGVYGLNSFRLIGVSGDQNYSFGFWFPNLQGLLGDGPDKTFVQMNANSMTQAQLDRLATMDVASFNPSQMGLCRLDGSAGSPVLLGGLTFRAADQQMLTAKASDLNVFIPQPAPHNGVCFYGNSTIISSYVRYQGAGRAINSQPPFEHANASTQKSTVSYYHCEFDGRRSPDLDPAQPRRCGVVMGNNETYMLLEDCWMHHSNVSRYAVNDQNYDTSGQYIVRRTKANNISETANTDPALNGGASLGGGGVYTPAYGWESCNGTITVENSIIVQDGTTWSGSAVSCHLSLTTVGNRNPQGGRMYVTNTTYVNNGFPDLTDYICLRVRTDTYWYSDGYNTTLFIYHPNGQRLAPYYVSTWPPSRSSLIASNILPETHYLVVG